MTRRFPLIALLTVAALWQTQVWCGPEDTRQESAASAAGASSPMLMLGERLGFLPTDKLLIVNGDDVGMSHAANAATIDALENGLMTSATIMMPCPWVPEIAAYARAHPKADFGLHLTHTSEWKKYRWGPVASRHEVPGLIDPDGYLWPDIAAVYRSATPEQAEIEARAQINKALAMGLDVTHLDGYRALRDLQRKARVHGHKKEAAP